MKKILRLGGLLLVAVFLAMQFFQPERNSGEVTAAHLYRQTQVPPGVQRMLNNACMDCHSNQTNYDWYHRLALVSWLISQHITEGKQELNFSEWGSLSVIDRIGLLEDMSGEVKRGAMPLKSYSFIHHEARLSTAQVDSLAEWIRHYQEGLLLPVSE
ncbi:heme-binding domain-containing protein [Gaoshiqia sediminis]|uniref:Heme-binding domain-containing protein n=1 Tax=Gaoshiqia sediminis TaxID=2986998 RepID=A0AA41Y678_9BACT|nr:heme-binding domain-containing protein [Gaoshiqia sediminis]MCW0482679.1 heme-binding domain-containing protein [Gaoshiqia sediminis]